MATDQKVSKITVSFILKGLVILLISNICYPLFFLHNVSNKCRHDFCVRKCKFDLLVVSNIANQLVIKNLNLNNGFDEDVVYTCNNYSSRPRSLDCLFQETLG